MKLSLVVFFCLISSFAQAGTGPFSLGAIVGDPTGLSGKLDFENQTSIDGALSWSSGGREGVQIHADYLRERPRLIAAGDTYADLYYGIGARLVTLNKGDDKGKVGFGPRVPVGLRHELSDPSVEFFGEVAFILDLTPSTAADLDVGIGARYRF